MVPLRAAEAFGDAAPGLIDDLRPLGVGSYI